MDKIKLPAALASLSVAREFVDARATSVSQECRANIELALEELLVNIVNHAYQGGAGEMEIACGIEGEVFALEFEDRGPAFDPLARTDPDTTKDLADREIGGLGIFLVKKLASGMRYERRGDINWLRATFRTAS